MDIWNIFKERILGPFFQSRAAASYEELARRFQLASPTTAANLLVTGKRMYARLLRAAVGEYEMEADSINAEIADLWQILAKSSNAEDHFSE